MNRLFFGTIMVTAFVAIQASAQNAPKFHAADADKDGIVTKQEFLNKQAEWAKIQKREWSNADGEKKFSEKDINGDGVMSGDELLPPQKK
ncbi:MAG: hypothetical protein HOO88_06460 [Kiritimatiellaceae bacterium]|nr:hypothetical protein [Kiritimatiellaceae bacterium]